jgi:DNA-binding transcriptional MerR regulator
MDEGHTWGVGELAAATGLTVRTLHHYDEVGVLRPSRRTAAGHRRYTGADVARLHRVTALRGFGFSLAEVGALLDGGEPADVRELVRRQLDQVEDRLRRARDLRAGLVRVLSLLDTAAEPSAAELVRLIEVMTAMDHSYSPEELERMAESRRRALEALSPQELARMTEERQALLTSLTPEELSRLSAARPPLPPPPPAGG